jgi:hypothetical protein
MEKDWKALASHPYAACWPDLTGKDWEEFKESIKASDGPREAIQLWNGVIIDGRQRHRACVELDIVPRFEDVEGDPYTIVLDKNKRRRQSTPSQLAIAGAKMEALLRDGGMSAAEARKTAASTVGSSERSVGRAARVVSKAAPEVVQKVESGKASVAKAEKTIAAVKRTRKKAGPQKKVTKEEVETLPIVDRLGHPVPTKRLQDVFATGPLWDEAKGLFKQAIKVLSQLAGTDAGRHLRKDFTLRVSGDEQTWEPTLLKKIARQVQDSRPETTPCPYCKVEGSVKASCKACEGRDWITKYTSDHTPPEEKK